MPTSWAIICHHYLNAWSLADILREVGWKGRIICLKQSDDGAALMELYGRGVEVWPITLKTTDELVDALAARIPATDPKVLFFTDERFLESLVAASGHPWLKSARFYPGAECRLGTILDRYAFYRFIEDHGLGVVPRTIPGDADPLRVLGKTFFFRFKRTWNGLRKMPRLELIEGPAQFEAARTRFRAQGFTEADWCFQEPLSLAPQDNVSVSGWHQEDSPVYVATHKVLQFPARQGNGDVCETLPLSAELTKTTRRLLDALRFTGPFELEFVRDGATGELKIIEMNPRYWMQHALVGAVTGQTLVRRHLGLPPGPKAGNNDPPKYWVNSVVALNRLLRLDFRGLPYLFSPRKVQVPPWGVTLRWLPRFLPNLYRRLRKH